MGGGQTLPLAIMEAQEEAIQSHSLPFLYITAWKYDLGSSKDSESLVRMQKCNWWNESPWEWHECWLQVTSPD